MKGVDWGTVAAIGSPVLVFLAAVIGFLFKRASDKKDRAAAAAKDRADREAKAAQEKADREAAERQQLYDQMQETLDANRKEMRSLQDDLAKARTEMTRQQEEMQRMWAQSRKMGRELDDAEAHIADVHRWDDGGRNGPMPQRKLPA